MSLESAWEELPTLNRSALFVRPAKAYLEWARSMDPEKLPFAEPDDDASVYLVGGELLDREAARKIVAKHWKVIAADQFGAWHRATEDWPRLKTIKDFEAYFTWEHAEMVHDLANEPLEVDEVDAFEA